MDRQPHPTSPPSALGLYKQQKLWIFYRGVNSNKGEDSFNSTYKAFFCHIIGSHPIAMCSLLFHQRTFLGLSTALPRWTCIELFSCWGTQGETWQGSDGLLHRMSQSNNISIDSLPKQTVAFENSSPHTLGTSVS